MQLNVDLFILAFALAFGIAAYMVEKVVTRANARWQDFYRRYPVVPGDIVMLGDSITDLSRWDELLPGLPVKNRGISADMTKGVAGRLDQITPGKPAAVFILIGTNDLPWYVLHTDGHIYKYYRKILQQLRSETPETHVFVQSLLPRARRYAGRVQRVNARLRELAGEYGCTYIDLYSHFVDGNNRMNPQYSNDALHLNGAGYALWVKILEPYLAPFRRRE